MKIGLITPTRIGLDTNPGTGMITAGIKWLAREATGATFDEIEMYEDIPSHWERAENCDVVLFCGNPRFTECPTGEWWDFGIWARLTELSQRVRVIDAWSGSCVGALHSRKSIHAQTTLIRNENNAVRFDAARALYTNIARDAVMAAAYEREKINHTLLPCSSWWARNEYGIEKQTGNCDTIVLADIFHHSWIVPKIQQLAESLRRPRIIACKWSEYHEAVASGIRAEYIPTPYELFKVFSESKTVRSFRIHAAIPAASMGCEVGLIATDSRHLTCAPFKIPVVTLGEWNDQNAPVRVALACEPDSPVEEFKKILEEGLIPVVPVIEIQGTQSEPPPQHTQE